MTLWRIVFLVVVVIASQCLASFWLMPSYNVFVERYREVHRLPPQPPENPWVGGFHWGWVMELQTDASLQQVQHVVRFRSLLLMVFVMGSGVVWLHGPW